MKGYSVLEVKEKMENIGWWYRCARAALSILERGGSIVGYLNSKDNAEWIVEYFKVGKKITKSVRKLLKGVTIPKELFCFVKTEDTIDAALRAFVNYLDSCTIRFPEWR